MKRLNLSYEKKKGLYGYGFIALWFVGALMFFIIPLLQSFYRPLPRTIVSAVWKISCQSRRRHRSCMYIRSSATHWFMDSSYRSGLTCQ